MQHVLQACEGRKKFVVFGPMQLGLVLPCGVLGCAWHKEVLVRPQGTSGSPGGTWPMGSRSLSGTSLVLGGHLV